MAMAMSASTNTNTNAQNHHHNSHSFSTTAPFEPLDPTTLAISLIPLLPPQTSNQLSALSHSSSLSLPLLAASLSTLPPSVINAINYLAQDLKSLREEHLISLDTTKDSGLTRVETDHERSRESRERWLENQKVNHLKKSISSLTSLHASLQSRLLTTVDTLSDLQQMHKRETQQLTDERDGVRAVNRVLKRKITALENQLGESKQIMESVLERVEVVNRGDWSIIEHGAIELFSPVVPSPSADADHETSTLTEDLCTFHQQCQADVNNHAPPPHSASHHPNFFGSVRSGPPNPLATSVGSEPRHNQRSLTLIVELTEELESLRQAIKVELQAKQDEISVLKGLVEYRDGEITRLMGRLEHFMGLDGFYVRHEDEQPEGEMARSVRSLTGDAEATPRQNTDQQRRAKPAHQPAVQPAPQPDPLSQEQLEAEIRQLEMELHEATQDGPSHVLHHSRSAQALGSDFCRSERTKSADDARSLSTSATSANSSDRHALSRALADLSTQVVDLKYALKEVSNERDTLKRLRAKQKSHHGPVAHQADQQVEGSENVKGLKEALERARSECTRLQRLLAQSEGRVMELERRLGSQEAEFEQVAERVQDKLQDQRSKLVQAKTQIEQLEAEINEARSAETKTRQELSEERRRVEMLKGLAERRTGSRKAKQNAESSAGSSVSKQTSKDPFLASGASSSNGSASARGGEKRGQP